MAELLSEIERFLTRTGMGPAAFGRRAIGDPSLLRDLKKRGRRLWPETEARVRDFMREQADKSQ